MCVRCQSKNEWQYGARPAKQHVTQIGENRTDDLFAIGKKSDAKMLTPKGCVSGDLGGCGFYERWFVSFFCLVLPYRRVHIFGGVTDGIMFDGWAQFLASFAETIKFA